MSTMITGLLRALKRVVVPEGLLLGVLVLAARVGATDLLRPYTILVGGVVFAAALALAWRFGRGRIAHALLVLVAAAVVTLMPAGFARSVAALFIPVDLALLALLPDRGPLSRPALFRLAGLAAQVGVVAYLNVATGFLPVDPLAIPLVILPGVVLDPVLTAYAAALAVLLVRVLSVGDALGRGMLWATAAALTAHLGFPGGTTWHLSAAAAVLLVAVLEHAYALAYRDGLTGLPSRRALDEKLQRISGGYTVAMVDVDHFKAFNDEHGHDVGDQVLRLVATCLAATPRARAFRYGGEEFTLLFRGRSLAEVHSIVDDLRGRVEASEFVIRAPDRPKKKPRRIIPSRRKRKVLSVTISVGVAERVGRTRSPWDVLGSADEALYEAKRRGRNRVVACPVSG